MELGELHAAVEQPLAVGERQAVGNPVAVGVPGRRARAGCWAAPPVGATIAAAWPYDGTLPSGGWAPRSTTAVSRACCWSVTASRRGTPRAAGRDGPTRRSASMVNVRPAPARRRSVTWSRSGRRPWPGPARPPSCSHPPGWRCASTRGLQERHVGSWTGLTRAEIEARQPGWLDDGRRPEGWEDDDTVPRPGLVGAAGGGRDGATGRRGRGRLARWAHPRRGRRTRCRGLAGPESEWCLAAPRP